jgi:PAS domain S-box-containing protein
MAPQQRATVLLIDDDTLVRRGMAVYLSDSGYHTIEAGSGPEGIDLFDACRPDVVLCDLRMPGMDGIAVLNALAARAPETPFLVVTGQGVLHDAIAALRHGAWDFITKPIVDLAVLELAIERALERARLLRDNRRYRERLERDIVASEAELARSEARLRSILQSFHQAFVVLFDRAGQVLTVLGPEGMQQRYGLSGRDAAAMDLTKLLTEAQYDAHQAAIEAVFLRGGARRNEIALALPGGSFSFEITYSAMRDVSGAATAVVGFVQDITDRRATEREAARLEAQLRQAQKLEAIGALAGGIAHDFNNILSIILGFAHLATEEAEDPVRVRQTLAEVHTAARRAAALVRQILTFSRRGSPETAPVLVAPVAREALKMLRASTPSSIEFEVEIDPACGSILGDSSQLHQILLNLGANACYAMRHRPTGRLGVGVRAVSIRAPLTMAAGKLDAGEYVLIRVSDTGEGMAQSLLDHIFEPFFTTKPQGEGTGMGLSTVHGIVLQAGGAIHVYTQEGQGTTFEVYLPRLSEEAPPPGDTADTALPTGRGRVLFVDDEEQIVLFAEAILTRLGYSAVGCSRSTEALRLFREHPGAYDLVVLDDLMPRMRGTELARAMRALNGTVPMVLMSGNPDGGPPQELLDALGIIEVLQKPLDAHTLAQAAARALKTRSAGPA